MYGYQHVKLYSDQDALSAMYIRYIRLYFGLIYPLNLIFLISPPPDTAVSFLAF